MKLFLPLFLFISFFCSAQSVVPDSAKYHIGSLTTVCGDVISVYRTDSGTVFLNFGQAHPHETFMAVIFKKDISKIKYDLLTLKSKRVCIIGMVKMYKGKPEIIIKQENQIRVQDDE